MPEVEVDLNLFTSLILYKIYDQGINIEYFSEEVTNLKYSLEDLLNSKDQVIVLDPIIRRSVSLSNKKVISDHQVIIYTDRVLSYE